MSYSFYLFDRDAWDDPLNFLADSNNRGENTSGQITLANPSAGQVVEVNNDGIADKSSVAGGLSQDYTISGVFFPAGSKIEMDYGFVVRDENGIDYFIGKIKVAGTTDTRYNGSVMTQGWDPVAQEWVGPPAIGSTFTLISVDDKTYPGDFNPWQRGDGGLREGPTAFKPYSNDVALGHCVNAPVLDTDFFPICFAAGTLIETATGLRPVETLVAGDLVRTSDEGLQPLIWVGRRKLNLADLERRPKWRPVRIRAGALGDGFPRRDMMVSPQHRILVRSRIARRMFDSAEVLVAAKDLVGMPGIAPADDLTKVVYVHLLFEKHQIIFADGTPTESFYIGPMALGALDSAARRELLELMPDLARNPSVFARVVVRGKMAQKLAERHQKNSRHLIEA